MAAVRAALEQRLKSLELELHQVERLQRKFAMIHSTLAQQQSHGAKGDPDTPKLRQSEENPLNMSMRSSLPGGGAAANLKVCGGQGRHTPARACRIRAAPACRAAASADGSLGCSSLVTTLPAWLLRRHPKSWARRPPSWPRST